MNYDFEISIKGDSRDINPLFKNCKIVSEQETDEVFYREKVNDEFTFVDEDYTFIKSVENEPCERIFLIIKRKCNGVEMWRGFASFYDFTIDEDRCKATAKFTTYDRYTCILENYNKKYNLLEQRNPGQLIEIIEKDIVSQLERNQTLKTAPLFIGAEDIKTRRDSDGFWYGFPLSSSPNPGGIPLFIGRFGSSQADPPIYYRLKEISYFNTDKGLTNISRQFQIRCTWATEVYYTADNGGTPVEPPGEDWTNTGEFNADGLRKWYRKPYADTGDSGTGSDFYWQKYTYSNDKDRVYYRINNWPKSAETVTYKRGLWLNSVIAFLFLKSCTPINLPAEVSQFLASALNPVTGKNNPMAHLYLFQKSDIVRYDVSEQARVLEVSLKEILAELKNMAQLYWDINESGRLRIEHISFYDDYSPAYAQNKGNGITIDAEYLKGTNKYSFKINDMVTEEQFTAIDSYHANFVGKDIVYANVCTNNRDEVSIRKYEIQMATDLAKAQRFPDAVELKGMFLLCDGSLTQDGEFFATNADLILEDDSDLFMPNIPLSLSNLHRDYWQHNRVLLEGEMNGQPTTFLSRFPYKERVQISAKLCCEDVFDANDYVQTDGWDDGEVITSEHDLKTDTIKLNLIYKE